MWHIYYVVNEMRIYIMEFQHVLDAYDWLKERCKEKQDGYYLHGAPVFCEYY